MAKTKKQRIYEVARQAGVASKEVIGALAELGQEGRFTASSSIEEPLVQKVLQHLEAKKAPKKAEPARPKRPQKAPRAEARPAQRPEAPKERPSEMPLRMPQERPPLKVLQPEPQEELLPEEVAELKVPERFKKDIEAERIEKFKAKPGMQRAFQAIRKVEPRFRQDARGKRRPAPRAGRAQRAEAPPAQPTVTVPRKKTLKLPEGATVKEFAELIGVKVPEVIKKFMELGYMPHINQPVDTDAAVLVADSYGVKLQIAAAEEEALPEEAAPEDASKLRPRAPVVTIMGHVDHGKTTLLDAIRQSQVAAREAGGITQHIGAYKVALKDKEIVFLDTPGHEAFTSLRARGAQVTDIVVLVVAADDGVKPQTIEAIDHAKAAQVPILVAINKIDKPEANPQKVKSELAELGIVPEDWGGQHIFVEVSAKQKTGIEELLEMILLQAEMMELKANPERPAKGVVIESRLDKGRGPVATLIVQQGTLRVGDPFLCGTNAGRVRALMDERGQRLREAGPATPVEVVGFSSVPTAGDTFVVMEDERKARQIALSRLQKQRLAERAEAKKFTLDELYSQIKEGKVKELNLVIKADAQGSVEALKKALEGITHPEVKVRVIHASVGGINESDVLLAAASKAIIIGFNVRPESKASQAAEREGVDVRLYNVIYVAIEDVKKALEGMLEPTLKERLLGRAEVRQTFTISKVGTVAGCYVLEGTMSRASDGIRVVRDNIVVYEGRIASLKRFKEDVRDVQAGYECGILIENFNDIKVGDILENYVIEKVAARL